MLDLDRVEMILPQVHLRNGEYAAEICYLNIYAYSKCYYTLHSHAALQRGISAPSFLTRSSAFAGVGLNIKQGHTHALCESVLASSHPLQSLNVHHFTGASLRIAHC